MNFKDFLNESYKTSISKDEAIDIIRKNDPSNILYRGMTSSDDFLILNGENGTRKSVNTGNYYTLLIDKLLKGTDYPLRSKSIICSSTRTTAKSYVGYNSQKTTYVIIPLKGTKVACTNYSDIWKMKFDFAVLKNNKYQITDSSKSRLITINQYYDGLDINDDSYSEFINDLKKCLSKNIDEVEDRDSYEELKSIFRDVDNLDNDVIALYKTIVDQFTLFDDASNIKEDNECWVGGKCLAIKYDVYASLKDQ